MDKVSAFFVGNVVGLTILVGGVLLTSPKKLKETENIQKQESARKEQAQAAQAISANSEVAADTDPAGEQNNAKELTPYVVATQDIAHGEKIVATAVKLEKLPSKGNQEALSVLKSVVGKTTVSDIHAGNTIRASLLKN